MARPRKKIDEDQVTKLAAIDCSYAEMASILGCNESTLTRRFAQAIKDGRNHGNMSLKRKQFEIAMGGNVGMLIWLGKQRLGQTDQMLQTIQGDVTIKLNVGHVDSESRTDITLADTSTAPHTGVKR